MGVWIHDKFWHGRYSLELGKLCVDAAFSVSEVQRLVGASAPDNRGSCSLMMAVGMSTTDLVMRDAETGVPMLLQEYSVTRAQWAQREATRTTFDLVGDASRPNSAAVDHDKAHEGHEELA
jgi:RimJ/RimL family protein N-acetyltransferase